MKNKTIHGGGRRMKISSTFLGDHRTGDMQEKTHSSRGHKGREKKKHNKTKTYKGLGEGVQKGWGEGVQKWLGEVVQKGWGRGYKKRR